MNYKFVTVISFILMGFANPVFSEHQEQLQHCAEIKNDTARLNCFDAVMAIEPTEEETSQTISEPSISGTLEKGDWVVTEEKDPITDRTNVTLVLAAETVSSRRDNVALILRCIGGNLELFISWDNYLSDNGRLTLRFGESEPSNETWTLSTDQTATFASFSRTKSFLKEALNNERFVSRITPYREGPTTAVFRLGGMDAAVAPLRKRCSTAF